MPFYEYEVLLPQDGTDDPDEPGQIVEIFQKMSDPPLTHHPETGLPIRRLISAPHVAGEYTEQKMKSRVSDDQKLGQLGFTKYVKAGDGYYEKRAGTGPAVIHKDKDVV